jgi:hypothetical protein
MKNEDVNYVELTEIQYKNDPRGACRIYVLGPDGYHHGGQWFARKVRYPDEEITTEQAQVIADDALAGGMEVRICDGLDFLVYHAKGGAVLFPPDPEAFWKEALGG